MARRARRAGAVSLRADGRREAQLRIGPSRRRSPHAQTRADVLAKLDQARWSMALRLPVRMPVTRTLADRRSTATADLQSASDRVADFMQEIHNRAPSITRRGCVEWMDSGTLDGNGGDRDHGDAGEIGLRSITRRAL